MAKLSYMAYLVHAGVIGSFAMTRTYEIEESYWLQAFNYFGVNTLSFSLALVFSLAFEIPFASIIKTSVQTGDSTSRPMQWSTYCTIAL